MICPACNQHLSTDAKMRGRSIQCPSCGEPLKVPEKSQFTERTSSGNGKKIALTVAIAVGVLWVSLAFYGAWKLREQILFQTARIARRTAGYYAQPANNVRYTFLANELWSKPYNGDLAGVKAMLDQNPQRLNARVGAMRATMLHVAAYGGQTNVVAELLRRGANVNIRTTQGHTPLYDCIFGKGNADLAKMLLDAKCNYTIPDITGKTPLQLAIQKNKTDVADLLRQYGATK